MFAATDPDRIDAFAVDQQTGALTPLNSSQTGTASVSHLSVDRGSRYVVGASYGGGAVCVVSINQDGSLGGPTDVVKHVAGPVISLDRIPTRPSRRRISARSTRPAAGSPSTISA